MKNTNFGSRKCFEMTVDNVAGTQAKVQGLISKCAPRMALSDCVAHKVETAAEQLLAAAEKIVNVGQDLKTITSCMKGVAVDAEADGRDLGHVSNILAWAGWTSDLTLDVLDAADELLRALHSLIGPSRSERKR
jgi:hypothetical protein